MYPSAKAYSENENFVKSRKNSKIKIEPFQ